MSARRPFQSAGERPSGTKIGGARGEAVRRFLDRLIDPMGYTEVDRCLMASVILVCGIAIFALTVEYADGWPYLPPDVDPSLMRLVARLARFAFGPWFLLLFLLFVLRERAPRSRALVYATTQLYAITIALFTYLIGPFYAPGWTAFLGSAVVGFLLFEWHVTILGIATFFALISTAALLGATGGVPSAPLLAGLSQQGEKITLPWAVRMGLTSLAFSTLTLGMSSYIITRWRDRERRYELLSKTDALTGIVNRRHFLELFEYEFARAVRYQTKLACVIVDLDLFKRVNDTYGHAAGDRVLVAAAEAIKRSVRELDVVARYGGEEFAILLPSTGLEGAEEVAQRCRRMLEEAEVPIDGHTIRMTASLGVASFPETSATRIEDVIKRADRALYRAKEEGRNRVVTSRALQAIEVRSA